MAKNNWQMPVLIGAGIVVALAAASMLAKPKTGAGYVPNPLGARKPMRQSPSERQPSRDYSNCGCGV